MNAMQFINETKNDVACLENALARYASVLTPEEKRRMKAQAQSLKALLPKES
jgi:hypothetical protein